MFITMSDFGIFHYPPETVAKYGDMKDWQNAVGTGPFMLTDYVSGSSITFARNPDYWMKDPLHPQNQLPYVDGVKLLIIPDTSTALSALRTGKLDVMEAVVWDDTVSLKKTSPDLQYTGRGALLPSAG
jgi:peptide/nickel transport system substrate-binding protein